MADSPFQPLVEADKPIDLYAGVNPDASTATANSVGTPAFDFKANLTGAALMDPSKEPTADSQNSVVEQAKGLLADGKEYQVRADLALKTAQANALAIQSLGARQGQGSIISPEDSAAIGEAYKSAVNDDWTKRINSAIEQKAVDNIQSLLTSGNDTEAKVLYDLHSKGDAYQVVRDNAVKNTIVAQRLQELQGEVGDQGWLRWGVTGLLNWVPGLSNFAASGIVGGSGSLSDWLFSGTALSKQGAKLWNMPLNDFADYMKSDGEFMNSLRSNASQLFVYNPDEALGHLQALHAQTDSDRRWADAWSAAIPASIVAPWVYRSGKLVSGLVRMGARSAATEATINAAKTLAEEGTAGLTEKAGMTPEEVVNNLETSNINPNASTPNSVPLGSSAAVLAEASIKAVPELAQTIAAARMTDPAEIQTVFKGLRENIITEARRPILDVQHYTYNPITNTRELYMADSYDPYAIHQAEFTVGTKDGNLFKTKAAATTEAKNWGSSEVFQDVSGGWGVRATRDMPEAGMYTNTTNPPSQNWFAKFWKPLSSTVDVDTAGKGVQADATTSKLQMTLGKGFQKTFNSLDRRGRDQLSQVMAAGQNMSKWFNPDELNALYKHRFNRLPSEIEKSAYYDYKTWNDLDFHLRKAEIYKTKVFNGVKSAKMSVRGVETEMEANVNFSPETRPIQGRVYNATDNIAHIEETDLTDTMMRNYAAKGYVLVSPTEDVLMSDGTRAQHFLVKRSQVEIGPIDIDKQLGYKAGGHRVYTDDVFVKQAVTRAQPDTGKEYLTNPNTYVTARNIAEGRKWADRMNEALDLVKTVNGVGNELKKIQAKFRDLADALDETVFKGERGFPTGKEFMQQLEDGNINLRHPFEAVYDKELPTAYHSNKPPNVELYINHTDIGANDYYRTTGRMYYSPKGEALKRAFPDMNTELAPTLDPYETMSLSLNNIARTVGMTDYRRSVIERWVKTYANHIDMPNDGTFANATRIFSEGKLRNTTDKAIRNAAEGERMGIRRVLSYESLGQKTANETYRSVAEWALGSGDSNMRKLAHDAVYWWQDKKPLSFIHGLAFDMRLGLFNVSQMFVQMSTIASATLLSPIDGMRGMYMTLPMQALFMRGGSEHMLETLAKRTTLWKLGGFENADEFKAFGRWAYDANHASGVNDTHVMIGEYGPTASIGGPIRSVREAGRWPFNAAETNNRIVAARIAWGKAKEDGLKIGTAAFNQRAIKYAEDYSFNMSRASSAYWQKGALSIPTQFWAYNARMLEAMFTNKFSPAQRARLILGSIAIGGSAGNPALEAVSSWIQDKNPDSPLADIHTLAGTFDRGFLDKMINATTGADVRVGERISIGPWVREVIDNLFGQSQYGEKSFAEIGFGPTGALTESVAGGGLNVLKQAWNWSVAESGGEMGQRDLLADNLLSMAREISTVNIGLKTYMLYNYGDYTNKQGLIQKTDLPSSDAIFSLLFNASPQEMEKLGHLENWEKSKDQSVKDAVGVLRTYRTEAFNRPDTLEANMNKVNAFVQLLPPDVRYEALRRNARMTDPTFYDHVFKRYQEQSIEENISNQIEDENGAPN